jgi:5'-deoxynucleotidase YfbR-like HD superfamily hydrolase
MVDINPFLGHYVDFKDGKFLNARAATLAQVRTLFDGTAVKRFHTIPTVTENTVGQHSHGVAMLCMILTNGRPSANLLMKALTHDLAEQYTGDVPSPAKRALGVRKEFGEIEEKLLDTVGFSVHVTQHEELVLKLADCADGMLFCARERMYGNKSKMIKCAYKNYSTYVNDIMQELQPGVFKDRVLEVFKGVAMIWKENKGE